MFFRIKKIKGKEYTYIVENEWKRKSSRQKVRGYMGRVYRLDLKNNADFSEYIKIEDIQSYIEGNDKNKIIDDLVHWELFKHNADKEEFLIDVSASRIEKGKKRVAFHINDGFMCDVTLRNLLEFKAEGEEEEDGYRFARCFVEAGIKVPQEVFVGLFSKLYREL